MKQKISILLLCVMILITPSFLTPSRGLCEIDNDQYTEAINLNNQAITLHHQHKYAEAEPLYRQSLAIKEKELGPDHPSIATALNNLASLLQDQGKYGEADPLYRRALAIAEKTLGDNHPTTITIKNNIKSLRRR